MTQRPTRVGTQGAMHQAAAYSRTRTGRGTPRHMIDVPGVSAMTVMLVPARRTEGKFRHVKRAHAKRTGARESIKDSSRGRRHEILPYATATGGHLARSVEEVLVCERYPVQRPAQPTCIALAIERFRLLEDRLILEGRHAIQLPARTAQSGESVRRSVHRADLAATDGVGKLAQGEGGKICRLQDRLSARARSRRKAEGSSSNCITSEATRRTWAQAEAAISA